MSHSAIPLVRDQQGASFSLYMLGCVGIALISVHDAILLIVNHNVIRQVEQNPVGRWLLDMGQGEVWLFVGVKLFSTSVVVTALIAIREWNQRKANHVLAGVLIFQLGLLWYLSA